MTADEGKEPLLARDSLASDLGEAGRDDAERPRAVSKRRFAAVEHEPARETDDGKVDRVGDLLDRRVALHARHGLPLAVHGIGPAAEAARHDVAKEIAPDRAGSWRRSQHGHALGLEEGFEGGNNRRVVALVDMGAVRLGRRDGELELEDSLLELAGDIEPGVPEDAQHASVLGQHDRNEPLDAVSACEGRQLLEQPRSDPSTLELVRHREGNLGLGGITEPVVRRDRDDAVAAVGAQGADQRAALGPVRIQDPLDERRCERGHAVEAEVKALGREPLEERQQRIGVGSSTGGRSRSVLPSLRITSRA